MSLLDKQLLVSYQVTCLNNSIVICIDRCYGNINNCNRQKLDVAIATKHSCLDASTSYVLLYFK